MGVTIVGVCLVSFFSSHEKNGGPSHNTTVMELVSDSDGNLMSSEVKNTPMGYAVCS